jgi:hypothetical protein
VLHPETYEIAQRLRMSASADDTRLGDNRISVLRDQFNKLMELLADPRYVAPHVFCKHCGVTRVGFRWFLAGGVQIFGPGEATCHDLRGTPQESHDFIFAEPPSPTAMPSSWVPV